MGAEDGIYTKNSTLLLTVLPEESLAPTPGLYGTPSGDDVIITKEELEEYNRLKQQVAQLKDQYLTYAKEEDRIIAEQGTLGYLENGQPQGLPLISLEQLDDRRNFPGPVRTIKKIRYCTL